MKKLNPTKAKGVLLAAFFAASIVGSVPIAAYATPGSEEAQTLDYESLQKYSPRKYKKEFYKISHPNSGLKTADGIVDYVGNGAVTDQIDAENSNGDRGQNYAWSSVGYGDWVYVGTCYSSMGNTLQLMGSVLGDKYDKETMSATLNAMYNGSFFNGEEDGGNTGGILVKVNAKTGEVKLLMSKATNKLAVLFRNAVEYHGKLYFCGTVSGLPSIYEIDPENDDSFRLVHQNVTAKEYYAAYQKAFASAFAACAYLTTSSL